MITDQDVYQYARKMSAKYPDNRFMQKIRDDYREKLRLAKAQEDLSVLIDAIEHAANIPFSDVMSGCKKADLVMMVKAFSFYCALEPYYMTLEKIGEHINRKHSSVHIAKGKYQEGLQLKDPATIHFDNRIKEYLKSVQS